MESHVSAVGDTLMSHKQLINYLTPQLLEYLLSTVAKVDQSLVW